MRAMENLQEDIDWLNAMNAALATFGKLPWSERKRAFRDERNQLLIELERKIISGE